MPIPIIPALAVVLGAVLLWYIARDDMWFQVLRMCVAGIVCFGGLAGILFNNANSDDVNWAGVIIGGIGLAMLLRIMCEVVATEIHKLKNDSDGSG
jgi:hypothetical protein